MHRDASSFALEVGQHRVPQLGVFVDVRCEEIALLAFAQDLQQIAFDQGTVESHQFLHASCGENWISEARTIEIDHANPCRAFVLANQQILHMKIGVLTSTVVKFSDRYRRGMQSALDSFSAWFASKKLQTIHAVVDGEGGNGRFPNRPEGWATDHERRTRHRSAFRMQLGSDAELLKGAGQSPRSGVQERSQNPAVQDRSQIETLASAR